MGAGSYLSRRPIRVEDVLACLDEMEADDRDHIIALADKVSGGIKNMGRAGALELIAAVLRIQARHARRLEAKNA